ncbi:Sensor protein KdpD [Pseudomonas knackmussii B13]|uniref:histidine kinase n=1 Tax=Pseudomonas knackmussii (strain DSM 6978 / CCUG 54928 / LMG 23759 / B13) TaxID=1301098 RepID=A0A024HIT0_PSEKB|nr:two-component system sensor histidine kinase KdpD [Pseudomonas knackmussii]CDF84412.1 Sensor protein KdpD [Pseudomonas knackmussii B13]
MSDTQRPDPDQLLAQIRQDEAQQQRGRLKIFFGACAGVGKTYAMLSAARAALAQGTQVLVGVVETHGRAETEALLQGLERLPLRQVEYKGRRLGEFDLDGALARHPPLILIDELAHSNVAGSRHPKRWQDVEELLAAGIHVWSTMNVQHLESLNDIVGSITGIRVWETVPDRIFDGADEVVMVDLPPDDLLQRLKEGKVYLAHQAERAVRNFFRKGNLIALRELALRRTADRVDSEMLEYRGRILSQPVWGTRGSLLVGVGINEQDEKTVRSSARLASQLDVPWHAVYVETPRLQRLPEARRQRTLRTLKLAQELGAEIAVLAGQDEAEVLVKYARQHNLSKVVLGRRGGSRSWRWRAGLADRIAAQGADLDLLQIALPATRGGRTEEAPRGPGSPPYLPGYLMAVLAVGAITLVATPLTEVFERTNIVMLFLLAVVAVAVRCGRGPAVLAAFLAVASFDFFFVPPRFTLAISGVQYLVTFAVMLVVALVIGQMAAGLTYQARVAQGGEDRMRGLYEMSRQLSAALMIEQVADIASQFLASELNARSALFVTDLQDRLRPPVPTDELAEVDAAVAQWCFDKEEPAGHGTDTLPAGPTLYLPLTAPMRVRGVLAIQPRENARLAIPEQRRLLDTCASLLAISLERIHYIEVAQSSTLQMESERMRNSLIGAISHDLRTPLTSLVGLAEALVQAQPPLGGAHLELANGIRELTLRMNNLLNNLLDMARLESGAVELKRAWQPLEETIGSALATCRLALGERQVEVALPADMPLVQVDAVLFERVLVNLLENAAKYTPPGTPIHIGAAARRKSFELWIDDWGPGVPPGREATIFNKFERGRKESAIPGMGLGLALCRTIIEAHGGSISASNRPGGGARFLITLPRGEPPQVPVEDEPDDTQRQP